MIAKQKEWEAAEYKERAKGGLFRQNRHVEDMEKKSRLTC